MEDKATSVELLFEKAQQFSKTSAELLKLKAIDKTADVGSSFSSFLIITTFLVFSVFLLSIGISFWIGEMLGNLFYGFLIVSGFYLITSSLFYLFRNTWLKIPVNNSIIKHLLK